MQLKQLLTEDRAVSPVIGVILMVAITVILAAVIGTFVLGLGQNVQSTPQASFGFDFDRSNTSVNVTHNGGDRLEVGENTNNVRIVSTDNDETTWIGTSVSEKTISAGSTKEHVYSNSGTNVRVVWTGTNNESSATLGQQEAPA
ncbi:MAG: type IV pilin N-terminal domain-containing protein [Haloferacaceae archaeon]